MKIIFKQIHSIFYIEKWSWKSKFRHFCHLCIFPFQKGIPLFKISYKPGQFTAKIVLILLPQNSYSTTEVMLVNTILGWVCWKMSTYGFLVFRTLTYITIQNTDLIPLLPFSAYSKLTEASLCTFGWLKSFLKFKKKVIQPIFLKISSLIGWLSTQSIRVLE